MSSIRTPIAPIPPFKGQSSNTTSSGGGPLQPRSAPSQATAERPASIVAERTAKLHAVIKESGKHAHTGSKDYDPATGRRTQPSSTTAPSSKSSASRSTAATGSQGRSQQSSSKPRPQTRLEREKKKDYKDPANIGPWKLGKIIGQGASGRVRYAQHGTTGQQAAVKIIPKNALVHSRMSLREAGAKQNKLTLGIEREIVIMKLIEHPNLIGLWDVYETSTELYLIMEYVAGGELFDHLVARGKLTPSEARSYFRQIIYGLDYCHRFNICHRDLKPENLLLDSTKRVVKLADFGMAALQPSEKMLETSCGSPHYASPEIVSGKSYVGSASDIWSCGIILFALLCGRLPFDDPNLAELLKKVRSGKFHMPEEVEPAAKSLIWRMLEVDPTRRITMPDIMRHTWFTNEGREPARNPVTTSFADLASESAKLFAAGREGIDLDILQNLRTLWPELSEEDIIDNLLCAGTNWQKTFYTLLVNHRENHSADDDEDDDFDEQNGPHANQGAPERTSGNGAAVSSKERARPRRSVESSTVDSPTKSAKGDSQPPSGRQSPVRPAGPRAPATREADSGKENAPQAVLNAVPSNSHASGSGSGSRRASVVLDRRNSQRSSSVKPGATADGQSLPTPQVNARSSSRSASPTRQLSTSKRMSGAPTIAVPQVGDATVQKFFQEIADGLAMIRATGGATDPSEELQVKLEKLRSSIGAAASASEAPPPTPVIGTGASQRNSRQMGPEMQSEDASRFDDADDDLTSTEDGAGLPVPPMMHEGRTAPLSISSKTSQNNTSASYSQNSNTWTARKPVPGSRPGSSLSHHSEDEAINSARNAKIKAASLRIRADKSSGGKENAPRAASGVASSLGAHLQAKGLTRLQKKNPGLGLDIMPPTVSVSAPGPSSPSAFSASSAMPSPNPSVMSGSSSLVAPSPKQSWFAGLFNWKPASYSLYSMENLGATTTECRRLLHSYGVRTVLEDAESELKVAVLKCVSAEVRDPSGLHVISKPVRFRVEFSILPIGSPSQRTSTALGAGINPSLNASPAFAPPGTPRSSVLVPASPALSSGTGAGGAGSVRAASIRSGTTSISAGTGAVAAAVSSGFATSMVLVQEKGALSTFKGIHTQLRRDWELDMAAPLSPGIPYPASPRLA
ncbi:serine/threonine-protein kinase gin4 [Tilletia horrida]|nr:serine/threonine-protein kinase gin4 [Tilletia horrida]